MTLPLLFWLQSQKGFINPLVCETHSQLRCLCVGLASGWVPRLKRAFTVSKIFFHKSWTGIRFWYFFLRAANPSCSSEKALPASRMADSCHIRTTALSACVSTLHLEQFQQSLAQELLLGKSFTTRLFPYCRKRNPKLAARLELSWKTSSLKYI